MDLPARRRGVSWNLHEMAVPPRRPTTRSRGIPAMPRIVRGGLIQATLCEPTSSPVAKIRQAMVGKHVALIAEAQKLAP